MVSRSVLPQPGDTVRIEHPHVPSGLAVVRARTLSRQDHLARLTLIISTGIVPAVTLAGRSRLFSVAGESMIVQYRDGWATFTITDDHGNVLSGAAVTLDGTLTRNTDATGRVQFNAPTVPQSAPAFAVMRCAAIGAYDYIVRFRYFF